MEKCDKPNKSCHTNTEKTFQIFVAGKLVYHIELLCIIVLLRTKLDSNKSLKMIGFNSGIPIHDSILYSLVKNLIVFERSKIERDFERQFHYHRTILLKSSFPLIVVNDSFYIRICIVPPPPHLDRWSHVE